MTTLQDFKRRSAAEQLVRATLSGLAERGVDVTVDDVARIAGTSRRTVFRYFPSRDEMLATALTSVLEDYKAGLPRLGAEGWQTWLAEVCAGVHLYDHKLRQALSDLMTRQDLPPRLATVSAELANFRRLRNRQVAETLWTAIGRDGSPPNELCATVAAHLSPHFTSAVVDDADGDEQLAACVANAAILGTVNKYR